MREKRVGPEIRCLGNLIKREHDASAVKAQLDRLTGLHGWVIGFLARAEGPVFQRDLEKRFSIRRSTVSNIVSLMEKNGFLTREAYEGDARLKQLVLTERAWEIHRIAEADMKRINDRITEGISKEELDMFYSTLQKMKDNLERKEHDA